MKIFLPNIKHKHLLFFDIEYDQNSLVQLALITLSQQEEPSIFEVTKSINVYVKQNRLFTDFFKQYTNITDEFLCDNGIDLSVARTLANEIVLDDMLLIGHGLRCDLEVLLDNGIDWTKLPSFDTYEVAKTLLKRNKNLTVKDLAALDGFYMFNEHNAYADLWGTLHAFCFLNKQQEKTE